MSIYRPSTNLIDYFIDNHTEEEFTQMMKESDVTEEDFKECMEIYRERKEQTQLRDKKEDGNDGWNEY